MERDNVETPELYKDPADIAELKKSVDLPLEEVVGKPDKINLVEDVEFQEIDRTTGDANDKIPGSESTECKESTGMFQTKSEAEESL